VDYRSLFAPATDANKPDFKSLFAPSESGGVTEIAKGGIPQNIPPQQDWRDQEAQETLKALGGGGSAPRVGSDWQRSTVLPFARNDATGDVSPAVPGLVQGLIDMGESAATLPGDVYAGRVDPNSDEGGRRAAEFGLLANPVSAASKAGVGFMGVPKNSLAPTASKVAAPSTQELGDMARLAYKRAEDAGLVVKPESFKRVVAGVVYKAKKEGIDPTIHPKATAAAKRLVDAVENAQPKTLQELDTLRRVVKAAAASIDPDERRIATIMIDRIDDYLANLTAKDVAAGDANVASNSIMEARSLWARMRKAEVIDELFEKAKNAVGANYTQAGMSTALRQQFRQLLNNKKAMRGFSKEEQAAIRRVVRGGPVENVIRLLSKMAPRGVVSGGFGLGVGATMGPMAGGAAMLTGELARRSASAMAMRNANKASELIRRGGS
jgi:hypothetical protein